MDKLGWFDKPEHVRWIMWGLYAICALLLVLDFVLHRHIYVYFEELPTFYALYGFVACVVLVLLAKIMRVLLMRKEDYYDKNEEDNNVAD